MTTKLLHLRFLEVYLKFQSNIINHIIKFLYIPVLLLYLLHTASWPLERLLSIQQALLNYWFGTRNIINTASINW